MPRIGTLYIVSAPSGAGKTTLTRALLDREPHLRFSVSTTTRARRPGERNGVDYHFVAQEEFERLVAEGAFLEHAFVHGHYYGTRRDTVQAALDKGVDLLLDIDVQGAAQIRAVREAEKARGVESFRAFSIFIMPPGLSVLERRLRDRGTNTEDDLERRLERAAAEIQEASKYDVLIVNDDQELAIEKLVEYVCRTRS